MRERIRLKHYSGQTALQRIVMRKGRPAVRTAPSHSGERGGLPRACAPGQAAGWRRNAVSDCLQVARGCFRC